MQTRPTLTKKLVHAAAHDAAAKSARNAGRAVWNDADSDVYETTFNAIFEQIGGVDAWIDLPAA
jgi:hypothetical protein